MKNLENYFFKSTIIVVLVGILCFLISEDYKSLNSNKDLDEQRVMSFRLLLIELFSLAALIILFITNLSLRKRNNLGKKEIFISRTWLSKALLSMKEAIIATDNKGVVTSMNKTAEELTGWKLTEAAGNHIDKIFNAIHEHTLTPIENPIIKALKENKVTLMANHTILIKRDRTQRVIIDSAIPIHDNRTEIAGGVLVFMDVTKQTNSQKKLEESEELIKSILENTKLIIYIKDLEGKYLLVNRQKEKVFNVKSEDLIGNKSVAHLTKEAAELSMETDKRVVTEKRLLEYEQIIIHADGTKHNYQTSKFPIYNSERKVIGVCALSMDISESKKNIEMKEKLARQEIILKSELRYDELTRNMPNMFFSLDHLLRHTSFNKACEIFTGKKAEQVIGKTLREVFPGGDPLFLLEYKEVLESGKAKNFISTFTIEENTYTYIVNIYPTENGISVLMTDLTKQKKSELETLELVDRLQRKNKDLRQFAYTVSHDLRAPIARVLGLVTLSDIDPKFQINDKTILQNVANEINNLDNIVKDMNATISVRDEEKKQEYIEFQTELQLIKKVLEKEILESKAIIIADFEDATGVLTVKSYLYSILYNLLSNAIKYRSPEVPLAIYLKTEDQENFICLFVKDNGMGIDMKKNGEKIFGLYNRFHGKGIEGKGIGLNLVKAQAESLGGKAEVESEVGVGSIFKIFFPKTQTANVVL